MMFCQGRISVVVVRKWRMQGVDDGHVLVGGARKIEGIQSLELLDRALHFWYYHFYFSRWESLHDCTLQQVSWVLQFVAKLMLCLQALAMFVLTNMIVNVCLYLC